MCLEARPFYLDYLFRNLTFRRQNPSKRHISPCSNNCSLCNVTVPPTMSIYESKVSNLSPVDWLMPRTYVCQILCFPTTKRGIFPILKAGLERTVKDIPFLLAGVADQNKPEGAVKLSEPYQEVGDILSFCDLTRVLDYAKLKEKNFSPKSITTKGILPAALRSPAPDSKPVFRARLLPIKGGALLFVAAHHSVVDITAVGTILKIWANYCSGGSSPDFGFEQSWLDRGPLSELSVPDAQPLPSSLPELLQVSDPHGRVTATADYETRTFRFPPEALQSLKDSVNEQVASQGLEADWVSTGDVLTALLWSASAWSESQKGSDTEPDGGDSGKTCVATVPVNIRSKIIPPLPAQYLGAAFVMAPVEVPRADLLLASEGGNSDKTKSSEASAEALARIAARVRGAIHRVTDERVRALVAHIRARPDIRDVQIAMGGGALSFISWAAEGVCELGWGHVLGRCETVRLPNLVAKRYPLVLPRLSDGSYEMIACFDKDMMERFQGRVARFGAI